MTEPRVPGIAHYLDITITEDDFDAAQGSRSHSGRCMIAQGLVAKYGKESRPIVDSDYIRINHPKTGNRLYYRTPPAAAAALISFDAGIKPQLPIRIRANASFERRARHGKEVTITDIRRWAKDRPVLKDQATSKGALPGGVIEEYKKEHPQAKIRSDIKARTVTSHARSPKTIVNSKASTPASGNLTNSPNMKVPESRRRTWGSRKLTAKLIEQGWIIPDGM